MSTVNEILDMCQLLVYYVKYSCVKLKVFDTRVCQITLRQFHVSWASVASSKNLQYLVQGRFELPNYSPRPCYLPPSHHEQMYLASRCAQDVYNEKLVQGDAAHVRILDPVSACNLEGNI